MQKSALTDMGQAMLHRGPDGIRTWHDGYIGMGLCSFDTTPGSGARQLPFMDGAAGLVISADARLDNRDELKSGLGLQNGAHEIVPDSRLILQAYRKWGAQCVKHLLGDFVFVIWDMKLQQLFCARDHLGIKPFYYHISEQTFACASEVRSLLKVPRIPDTINEARIADFLISQLEGFDKTSTFYTAIQRLPPAHTLLVRQSRQLMTEYWRLDPELETKYQSDAEYIEAFREILLKSVRARLRCLRRPAMLLSGGIDSAAVTAYANLPGMDGNNHSLDSYSAISATPAVCRESHYINRVSKHLQIIINSVTPHALRIYNEKIHGIFNAIEEPYDEMTVIILLYLAIKEKQHDVVLDGAEGDMIYSLSAVYPGLLIKQGRILRGMGEIYGCWEHRYNRRYPLYKTVNDAIRPVLVPRWLRQLRRSLPGSSSKTNTFTATGINPEFAEQVHAADRLKKLQEYHQAARCKTLRELHIQNITHPYLTVGLERYDRLAALCQVEPRHPLLDKRLVEFSCSLPWDQKVRYGWSKYLLRKACLPYLPADVVWRKGWEHLGWSYTTSWIINNGEAVTRRITDVMPQLQKYMSVECLNNMLGSDRGACAANENSLVWSTFLLASWLQNRTGVH